jgi:hypothetical protein
MVEKERDVLEIIDDEPEDDRVEEPDSQGQISTPPQPQPKAQKSSKSDSKKRAAEESLNNGRPKRERSSADKIQAGLESLLYLRAQMSATSSGVG